MSMEPTVGLQLSEDMTEHVLPISVFIGVEAVLGFLGNLLILHVYARKYPYSNFRYFVLCLATIDLTSCLTTLPGEVYDQLHWYDFPHGEICKLNRFFNVFTVLSSGMTLMLIAFDRHRKVCKPMARQIQPSLALKLCVAIICGSAVIASPTLELWGIQEFVYNSNGSDVKLAICDKAEKYKNTSYPFAYALTMFIIPVWLIIFIAVILNICLARKIFSKMKPTPPSRSICGLFCSVADPSGQQKWKLTLEHSTSSSRRGEERPKMVSQIRDSVFSVSLSVRTLQSSVSSVHLDHVTRGDYQTDTRDPLQERSPRDDVCDDWVTNVHATATREERRGVGKDNEETLNCTVEAYDAEIASNKETIEAHDAVMEICVDETETSLDKKPYQRTLKTCIEGSDSSLRGCKQDSCNLQNTSETSNTTMEEEIFKNDAELHVCAVQMEKGRERMRSDRDDIDKYMDRQKSLVKRSEAETGRFSKRCTRTANYKYSHKTCRGRPDKCTDRTETSGAKAETCNDKPEILEDRPETFENRPEACKDGQEPYRGSTEPRRDRMTRVARNQEETYRRMKRKTLIMVILTSVYVVTTGLYLIIVTFVAEKRGFLQGQSASRQVAFFFFWRLYFVNCVINPVLYGFLDPRFRHGLKQLFSLNCRTK